MISRRAFLKALGAAAASAVVPLPLPVADPFAVMGTVTAYFKNTDLYKQFIGARGGGKDKCFIRFVEESSFGEHPITGRDIWESGSRDYPKGVNVYTLDDPPKLWLQLGGHGSYTRFSDG